MTTTKDTILNVLLATQGHMTVAALHMNVPGSAPLSTIARALRRLREQGFVTATRVPGNPRYKQWAAVAAARRQVAVASQQQPQQPHTNPNTNRSTFTMDIQQGVHLIVAEFALAKKSFSAHDVTRDLRDRVTAGTLGVAPGPKGTVHINGADFARISHTDVRDHVHDLFNAGQIANYDRTNNGQYWEYAPAAAAPVVADPTAAPAADPTSDDSSYDGSPSIG